MTRDPQWYVPFADPHGPKRRLRILGWWLGSHAYTHHLADAVRRGLLVVDAITGVRLP